MQQRRGPRGDIDTGTIRAAADRLLARSGTIDGISLRAVAAEVGVAVNAIYTYFPSLSAIWHDLADSRFAMLDPTSVLDCPCPHCAVRTLVERTATMMAVPGTLSMMRAQPVLGPHSFALSETLMELTAASSVGPRNAHDMIVGWFFGSSILELDGWTSGTDEIRESAPLEEFPRIAARGPADRERQLEALLAGIGVPRTCSA
jgi:AcrR family transcriptional regulator